MSEGRLIGCVAAIVVVVLVVVGWFAIRDHSDWEAWCQSQGGHVVDHSETSTTVVVGTNGQPALGVGSSTTYYCLSADGRILGIR